MSSGSPVTTPSTAWADAPESPVTDGASPTDDSKPQKEDFEITSVNEEISDDVSVGGSGDDPRSEHPESDNGVPRMTASQTWNGNGNCQGNRAPRFPY